MPGCGYGGKEIPREKNNTLKNLIPGTSKEVQ
jgi:hypothetical protein